MYNNYNQGTSITSHYTCWNAEYAFKNVNDKHVYYRHVRMVF